MRDEASFVKAILADPDDTGLRLVFADWLEEHGAAARAELIRVECERDALPRSDPRREGLNDRAAELARGNAARWFGPIPKLVEFYGTARGFVEAIELSAVQFVKHARTIFALAPVRDVFVTRHYAQFRAFTQCAELARVTRLGFCDANADEYPVYPLEARGASLIAASPHLGNLRELTLTWNRIGPGGVGALARAPQLSGLRSLDVSGNGVGPRGAEELARAAHLKALTHLNLSSNALGDEGARALVESPHLGKLASLDLGNNAISPAQRKALQRRFGKGVCRF
jgi:uncharacterized protein (TIGR02996 family)